MSKIYDLGRVTEPAPVIISCYSNSVGMYRHIATVTGVKNSGFCKISYDAVVANEDRPNYSSTGEIIFSTAGVWNSCAVNMQSQEFAIVKQDNKDGTYTISLYALSGNNGRVYYFRKGACYNRNGGEYESLDKNFSFIIDGEDKTTYALTRSGTLYITQTAFKVDIDWGNSAKIGIGENITFWANPSIADGVTYQWYHNGTPIDNKKRFITIFDAKMSDAGTYTVGIVKATDSDTEILTMTSIELSVEGTANNIALNKSYEYLIQPVADYGDSGGELTDGIISQNTNYYDGKYVGIRPATSSNPVVYIDLGGTYDISRVSVALMNAGTAGISFPKWTSISTSDDKKTWQNEKKWTCPDSEIAGVSIATFNISTRCRYIKLHSAETNYLFMSEILVYGE